MANLELEKSHETVASANTVASNSVGFTNITVTLGKTQCHGENHQN